MNAMLYDVALTAYIVATAAALGYLLRRRDGLSRLSILMTQIGWVCHTVALVVRGVELGRPPLVTLPEVVSVVIWAAVLLELWAERQYQVKVLGAFVLPVILMLGLALPTGLRALVTEPSIRSAWIWVHVILALLGLAALVLNFAGAVMYLLQEHQLKAKRPGTVYYRLPSLETLDQFTFRTLTLGFPFLTAGLLLGILWAGSAWGSVFAFDPRRVPVVRDVGGLRRDAVGAGDRRVAGPPRRLLRHRGLLRALADARRGRVVPGTPWLAGVLVVRPGAGARMLRPACMGALFVCGLSHHTAPIEVREQLALESDKVREILADLAGTGVLAEAMILATCNRVEVYGLAEVPGDARRAVFNRLGGHRGFGPEAIEPMLYTKTEDEAVLHVFRVAASLDSMILGEPQILGQVKDAFAVGAIGRHGRARRSTR